LTGKFTAETSFSLDDHRSRSPEFQGKKFVNNLTRIDRLRAISSSKGATIGQLALRWILDNFDRSCALFGAKTEQQVSENLGASGWNLTSEELTAIETATLD
jgi:myo-inositol catabolism protein IolS